MANHTPPSQPEPKVLGDRFEIRELLGARWWGPVYRVWDHLLTEERVLIVLRHELAVNPTCREQFGRGVRTLRSVEHPHIITGVDFGKIEKGGRLFLSVPVYRGGALWQRIHGGPQPEKQVINWATQLLTRIIHEASTPV